MGGIGSGRKHRDTTMQLSLELRKRYKEFVEAKIPGSRATRTMYPIKGGALVQCFIPVKNADLLKGTQDVQTEPQQVGS